MARDLLLRNTDFTDDEFFRYKHNIVISRTPLFGRILDVATMLQWNKGDLGLGNYKPIGIDGEADQSVFDLFTWKPGLKTISGGEREHAIHDYWLAREEPVNIMLDACLQAYLPDTRALLGNLTKHSYASAEYCAIRMRNTPRRKIGQPDCLFIDMDNRRIALIEIKIAATKRKFDADQALKYFTLSRLLSSKEFYSGFAVDHLLIGKHTEFEANSKMLNCKIKSMQPCADFRVIQQSGHQIDFKLISQATHEPIDVGLEADQRLSDLCGIPSKSGSQDTLSILNVSWNEVRDRLPAGYLQQNIHLLLPFLAGDHN